MYFWPSNVEMACLASQQKLLALKHLKKRNVKGKNKFQKITGHENGDVYKDGRSSCPFSS